MNDNTLFVVSVSHSTVCVPKNSIMAGRINLFPFPVRLVTTDYCRQSLQQVSIVLQNKSERIGGPVILGSIKRKPGLLQAIISTLY